MASSKGEETASIKNIEAALKLVDTKKESLKRAYDDLQTHSSLLSSFSLSWSDLDSHFSAIQKNLTHRFHHLQSIQSSTDPHSSHDPVDSIVAIHESGGSDQSLAINDDSQIPKVSDSIEDPSASDSEEVPVQDPALSSFDVSIHSRPARPELVLLWEKKDGEGLRNYFSDHPQEREAIRGELLSLMRDNSDAGAVVLDAIEGFYRFNSRSRGDKDMTLHRLMKSCVELLEVLTVSKPNLRDEVKRRAKKMALEWKERVHMNGDNPVEALGFLNLLVAFELGNEFDADELLNIFVIVARCKHAAFLCRAIGLGDKITDLVQKLIENSKQFLAVKFILEFGLTEKFEPVPLLKEHLKETKQFTAKICKDEKNSTKAQNDARSREINALRSVLKIIDEHKLDAEYPRHELEKEIEMLEKQKVAAPSPDNRNRQQPKKQQLRHQQSKRKQGKRNQQNGSKHPRTSAATVPAAVPVSIAGSSSTVPSYNQSQLPPTVLSSAAGPYGLLGSTPNAAYAAASAGPYSLPGAAMGFTGNPSPAGSHQFSDPYMSSSYYNRSTAYGGYGFPPHYHPGYYPQ